MNTTLCYKARMTAVHPILPLAEKDEQAERAAVEQALEEAQEQERLMAFLAQLEAEQIEAPAI